MVRALHKNNIGVVFDAVYNHTAAIGAGPMSIFDKVVPHYYYRIDRNGQYAKATGCGNEFASEKPMARKFILDSVKYWMLEYHIDGFRFDLMGIEDRDTMLEVYREARQINPNAIIYGEGWDMEKLLPRERMMTQANVKGTGIAAFNDGIRDSIKGSVWRGEAPGFVQGAGPGSGLERFLLNIKGQCTGPGVEVVSPNETVNYDSAHDDHCLWDKLLLTTPDVADPLRINMDKLAAGIVLTAQGVPFLHAGDEFLRSKNRVKNSYNSNDPRVNPIDWGLKSLHREVFDFYRGMIALRKAHPAFRMGEKAAVDRSMEFVPSVPTNVVAYVLRHNANGDSWKAILVVYNGNRQAQEITVPGNWIIVANDKQAGTEALGSARDKVPVEACSLVVAHTEEPVGFTSLVEAASSDAVAKISAPVGRRLIGPFDYRGVTLEPGPLRRQVDEVRRFYLAIPDDDLLKGFRTRAGLPAPGKDLGGWYSSDTFLVFGQIVSGLARLYASTGDIACRDKADHLLAEWTKCIEPDGYFYASRKPNAPHYIYDKMLWGLLDSYLYCGNREASTPSAASLIGPSRTWSARAV